MSRRSSRGDTRGVGDPHPRRDPHPTGPGCRPGPGRVKRRKTKRERDTAKFGRKVPGGGQWGARLPPCRLLPLWGGRPPASPLPAPKTVVITQNRLCQHQGMFNREVKSVNVERVLSPCPGQDLAPPSETSFPRGPSPAPEGDPSPSEQDPLPSSPQAPRAEGEKGVPAELPLRELHGRLHAILGHTMAFPGRDLVGERRQAILAALLHQHRALPDLSLLLAHRNRGADAAPPGRWSPRTPERELSGGGSAEQGNFGVQEQSWDMTPPYSSIPAPLQAIVNRTPTYPARPGTPSPIFGGGDRENRETPFSWTSGEEDDPRPDSPAPLFQPREERMPSWGDPRRRRGPLPHGRILPGSPPARFPPGCTCRDPSFAQSRAAPHPTPAAFGEDPGEGCSWSHRPPIAPPAFSPVAPRHRHPPHHSITVPFASRCPDLCCGTSLDAQSPNAWSPEASRRLGFAPGWPYAERRDPRRHHHHPLRHHPLQHVSHRLGQPSVLPSPGIRCWQPSLERRPPAERWEWEDWWDVPEPRCRRGPGEQGWLRALRHLPLSCFPTSGVLERDGSLLPSLETWGCPCAGPY